MGQTTLRIDDDLLEAIEEATEPEETRSEWIREAIRQRLDRESDGVHDRLDHLEERLDQLEERTQRPLIERLFSL